MRAIVYLGDGEYALKEVPTPIPQTGEALIKVDANTICGTDLRIVSGAKKKGVAPPVILGHEVAGTVVEIGSGIDRLAIGDRVGMTPSIPCSWCWSCQRGWFNLCAHARVLGHDVDGGLAEYLLVPEQALKNGALAPAPPHLLPEEIALAEPLSCVLHAHQLIATGADDVVVVIGGGPIGQLHAQLARVLGARTVIVSEPVESRRALALRLGADIAINPVTDDLKSVVSDATDGGGADVVVLSAGIPELAVTALELARPRARISLFAGFPAGETSQLDPNLVHYRELIVTGSSNSTAAEYQAAMRLIADRRVEVRLLVTHRFALKHFADAIATAGEPGAMKVAVIP